MQEIEMNDLSLVIRNGVYYLGVVTSYWVNNQISVQLISAEKRRTL